MSPAPNAITSDPSLDKDQHWVAESYLKQWRDRSKRQGAYVWVSPKDRSSEPKMRSPKKTFVAADLNTMTKQSQRNLSLERLYGQFETKFGAIRAKIESGAQPNYDNLDTIISFVAAQLIRTPKFRAPWQFYAVGDHAEQTSAITDPMLRTGVEQTLTNIKDNQRQLLSFCIFPKIHEILGGMRMIILHTSDQPGFITSDAPCCIVGYADTPASLLETLCSKTGNLVMPLSPSLLVIFEHSEKPHEMIELFPKQPKVHEANAIIWRGAVSEIVTSTPALKDEWFSVEMAQRLERYSVL